MTVAHVTDVGRDGLMNGKVNDLHTGRECDEEDSNDEEDDSTDDVTIETLLRAEPLKGSVLHARQHATSSITKKKVCTFICIVTCLALKLLISHTKTVF